MHISVLLAFQFNYFFPFISCRRGFLKYFKKRLTPQDGNITMAKTLAEKEALGWIILPDPLYSVIIKLILYLFIHELVKYLNEWIKNKLRKMYLVDQLWVNVSVAMTYLFFSHLPLSLRSKSQWPSLLFSTCQDLSLFSWTPSQPHH